MNLVINTANVVIVQSIINQLNALIGMNRIQKADARKQAWKQFCTPWLDDKSESYLSIDKKNKSASRLVVREDMVELRTYFFEYKGFYARVDIAGDSFTAGLYMAK